MGIYKKAGTSFFFGVYFLIIFLTCINFSTNISSVYAQNFTIDRVWTSDTSGNEQTTFQPGESIQYNVDVSIDSDAALFFHGKVTGEQWRARLRIKRQTLSSGNNTVSWQSAVSANAREGTDAVVNVKVRRRFKTGEANTTFMIAQNGVIPTPTPTATEPTPTPTPGNTPAPGGSRVITTANMPIIGDFVEIAIVDSVIDPGPGGANQTWDFSDLTEAEEGFFEFLEPSATVFGDDFTSATLAGLSWLGDFSYFKLANGIFEWVGVVATIEELDPPDNTAKAIYSNNEDIIRLPFEFGDSFTDTFAGQNEVLDFTQNFTGTVQIEADGSGTLILPTGTFTNVVRYHLQREQQATGITVSKNQWLWISADHRFWLMLTETITTTPPGSTDILTWYNKNPISSQ